MLKPFVKYTPVQAPAGAQVVHSWYDLLPSFLDNIAFFLVWRMCIQPLSGSFTGQQIDKKIPDIQLIYQTHLRKLLLSIKLDKMQWTGRNSAFRIHKCTKQVPKIASEMSIPHSLGEGIYARVVCDRPFYTKYNRTYMNKLSV